MTDSATKHEPDLKVTSPPKSAGGLGALTSTFKHLSASSTLLRGGRALLLMNQAKGFDCPGCAWPEPKHGRSRFEFCENGAKAIALEANPRAIGAEFFAAHSVAQLRLQSGYWLSQQGRLAEPMLLEAGDTHYRPISWDAALGRVAGALRNLSQPDRAVFYTSGRTSNEAAFLYQLFVRMYGTNNLPDCSNLCHESSGYALKETVGVGKGTVQLEDFELADVILVIGQNPGTNHPRMMTHLQSAARRGCTIVSVNPLREVALERFVHPQTPWAGAFGGTPIRSLHIPVRVGGDVALFQGVAKALLQIHEQDPKRGVNRAFIEEHTSGFDALQAELDAASWATLVRLSGVEQQAIEELAEVLAGTEKVIACWAMGLTQHVHAVENIQSLVNVMLMRGALGQAGAGLCPVRGHSNVQGDRSMGITSNPSLDWLGRLEARYAFAAPRSAGFDSVAAIEAMLGSQVDVFFALGGNFAAAAPDTLRTALGLSRCGWTVHVSTVLNESHLATGENALILPCLGRTEADAQESGLQYVTVEDSMSVVHRSQGALPAVSSSMLSEPMIVARLAALTLKPHVQTPWLEWAANYDRIRDEIEQVVPGFDAFNARIASDSAFTLDNPARRRDFRGIGGRARFTLQALRERVLEPGQMLLMTIRSHDQYNTTVYGLDDRYRGIRGGRRVVLISPEDIAELGLESDGLVHLRAVSKDGLERRVEDFRVVAYELPRRTVACYFPEANPLVALGEVALGSRTPASKSVIVELERARAVE